MQEDSERPQIRDLWPDDLQRPSIVPPITVLRQQANLLRTRTELKLRGLVSTQLVGTQVRHLLGIGVNTSGALREYVYELVQVQNEVTNAYPATVLALGTEDHQETVVRDHEELMDALAAVFQDATTQRVIASL